MPIQINNVTVIDDDRNFNSPGITTVGSGTSIITIDGNNSKINVGTAVTIDGKTGIFQSQEQSEEADLMFL